MLKRALLYVVVLFILLALAVSAGSWDKSTTILQQQAISLSESLSRQLEEAQRGAGTGNRLLHRGDSLLSWSNEGPLPSAFHLKTLATRNGTSAIHLPQGWHLAVVSQQDGQTSSILVPICSDLPSNTTLLCSDLVFEGETPYPVKVNGQAIAWLKPDAGTQGGWLKWLTFGAWGLFLILLLSLTAQVGKAISTTKGWLAGTALVGAVGIGIIAGLSYSQILPTQFGDWSLFRNLFQDSLLTGHSAGEWLLRGIILVFVAIFFHDAAHREKQEGAVANLLKMAGANFLAMGALYAEALALHSIVYQQAAVPNFNHVLSLGAGGWATLAGVIALQLAVFFFAHRAVEAAAAPKTAPTQRYAAIGIAAALLAVLAFALSPAGVSAVQVLAICLVFAIALDLFVHDRAAGFGWAIVWLVVFSLCTASLLYQFTHTRERQTRLDYAVALAAPRDSDIAEKQLSGLLGQIRKDEATLGHMLKPWPFKAEAGAMRDYLNHFVFRENYIFQHYRLHVFAFDKDNQPILQGQSLGYEQVVLGNWATAKPIAEGAGIRYGFDQDGNLRYIAQLNLMRMGDATQPAGMYLFFDQTFPAPSRVYTQLFYSSPLKNLSQLHQYDFSIVRDGNLAVDQGLANMTGLGAQLAAGKAQLFDNDSRSDAVAKSDDGHSIAAVGRSSGGILQALYLFSILFTVAAFGVLLLAFINSFFSFLPPQYDFRITAAGSLARRIHIWIIALLALSFLVVGGLTYRHFADSAQRSARKDFDYRATALLTGLQNQAINAGLRNDSLTQTMARTLETMTASLGMDAGLYTMDGRAVYNTQEELTQLGVLPSRLSKNTLDALRSAPQQALVKTVQDAGVAHDVRYKFIPNGSGEPVGVLSVPMPDQSFRAGADVSDFIGMLAGLYVFLLLVAYGITFLLSRSIIKPLSLLSEKVQQLKLEDKNEPLAYFGDKEDEISQLILQYNTMVGKLEASKAQLVKLEREGAWREMARQVAHDIKNPLTTMKLSMQQLERVSGNPEQAAAYLRKAITRLIEQIDSLAQIASEFSMFANLDIKHKNDVVINEVVESVHDLFSEQRHVDLALSLPEERFHIVGDKNHLIRVFNNLVINAIQAIPSDRRGQIKVSLTRHGDLSVIQISDNGGGIPPEIRDRVFEPNFTTKTSGSGLGLAICKKIIEAHDGNIRFETRDNEGTDFFVEVPIVAVG